MRRVDAVGQPQARVGDVEARGREHAARSRAVAATRAAPACSSRPSGGGGPALAPAPRATARRGGGRGCPRRARPRRRARAPRRSREHRPRDARAPRARGPWRSSSSVAEQDEAVDARRGAASSASRAAGRRRTSTPVRAPRCRSEIDERPHEVGRLPCPAGAPYARPGRDPRRGLLARARGAAVHDDARRPRRRRREGRAPRRRRRHARVGPAVARRGRDVLPRAEPQQALGDARPQGPGRPRAGPARSPARADVVLESFRPGTIDRLGLGYDAVRAANPGVVYCSVSAFGPGEAAAALPGYDLLLQAMSGLMSVTGEPDGRPLKVGAALIDMLCGLHAASGHPRRAARPRARRAGPARRGRRSWTARSRRCSTRPRAYLNAGVVPGPHGQPPPEHHAVRDLPRPPTATSRSRVGNDAHVPPAVRGDRAARARRATTASPTNARAPGAPRRARRADSRRRSRRPTRPSGSRASARPACPPARSTTSAGVRVRRGARARAVDEADGVRTVRPAMRCRARPPACGGARRASASTTPTSAPGSRTDAHPPGAGSSPASATMTSAPAGGSSSRLADPPARRRPRAGRARGRRSCRTSGRRPSSRRRRRGRGARCRPSPSCSRPGRRAPARRRRRRTARSPRASSSGSANGRGLDVATPRRRPASASAATRRRCPGVTSVSVSEATA